MGSDLPSSETMQGKGEEKDGPNYKVDGTSSLTSDKFMKGFKKEDAKEVSAMHTSKTLLQCATDIAAVLTALSFTLMGGLRPMTGAGAIMMTFYFTFKLARNVAVAFPIGVIFGLAVDDTEGLPVFKTLIVSLVGGLSFTVIDFLLVYTEHVSISIFVQIGMVSVASLGGVLNFYTCFVSNNKSLTIRARMVIQSLNSIQAYWFIKPLKYFAEIFISMPSNPLFPIMMYFVVSTYLMLFTDLIHIIFCQCASNKDLFDSYNKGLSTGSLILVSVLYVLPALISLEPLLSFCLFNAKFLVVARPSCYGKQSVIRTRNQVRSSMDAHKLSTTVNTSESQSNDEADKMLSKTMASLTSNPTPVEIRGRYIQCEFGVAVLACIFGLIWRVSASHAKCEGAQGTSATRALGSGKFQRFTNAIFQEIKSLHSQYNAVSSAFPESCADCVTKPIADHPSSFLSLPLMGDYRAELEESLEERIGDVQHFRARLHEV